MTSFFWYLILKNITILFINKISVFLDSQSDSMKRNGMFVRIIGIDLESLKEKQLISTILSTIGNILLFTIRTIYYLLHAIFKHSFKSIYNLIDMLIMILILILIQTWIKIVTEDEFYIEENAVAEGGLNFVQNCVYFQSQYLKYASITIILLLVRMTRMFSFSSKLSIFSDIIDKSWIDITFFILMFSIFLLIFSLTGYMIFGVTDEQFRDFGSSVFRVFLICIGNSSAIAYYSQTFVHIFGIIYVLFVVILLNMFIAIIL